MTDWSNFPDGNERNQARFLLRTATSAWDTQHDLEEMGNAVRDYLRLGYEVLDGQCQKLPQLIRFIEDPQMKSDFSAYFEIVKEDKKAAAALDLASYACAFVSRLVAAVSGYGPLPDPVLEALPEIYEYYKERAIFLGV